MASSCGTDIDKATLRAHHAKLRNSLDTPARQDSDAAIAANLFSMDVFNKAPLVLTYVSYRSEVDTRALICALLISGKRVAVPRCEPKTHKMSFFEISGLGDLESGAHGILEPKASLTDAVTVPQMVGSVCLVPGLIFDGAGRRIGYGGGYYDRFLAFYPGEKIGLARGSQISGTDLPQGEYDVPLDHIVTENGAWSCR